MRAAFAALIERVNVTVDPARREETVDVPVQPVAVVPPQPTDEPYRVSVAVFNAPVYDAAVWAGKVID
jgi:hypothetical protein